MKYHIHITKVAEEDIVDAIDYIDFILKNPDAADHLLDLIDEKIAILSASPHIHPIIEHPVLKFWEIRYIVVNNYLAFYQIDEKDERVYILRFLYKKRDWISILEHDISFDEY